jgi:hypothetical protein
VPSAKCRSHLERASGEGNGQARSAAGTAVEGRGRGPLLRHGCGRRARGEEEGPGLAEKRRWSRLLWKKERRGAWAAPGGGEEGGGVEPWSN